MDKLTLIKIVVVLVASIYLTVYGVFLSAFYALTKTGMPYSILIPITTAMAIIFVIWVPFDWAVQKITV